MLEVAGLEKHYGRVTALDGASFQAAKGRIVGFLGRNGAGKTTAMRCIFGLAKPDAGTVTWDGRPIDQAARYRFGYMPEQRGLYPRMKILDQLSYFGQHHGLSGGDSKRAAGAWLERFGLADRGANRLEDLSHGNQQRVQLAAALIHDPVLLVLDEPFSGLDPVGIATMSDVLRERAANGVAVLFSSHQLDLVEDICEDVVIIERGRIAAAGALAALKAGSGRHALEVEVEGSGSAWLEAHPGVTIMERAGDRAKVMLPEGVSLETMLAAATAAGRVIRFEYGPPALSELFMEAVRE
jgi:ABC-2 type transport system ATP-binding protein